MKNILVLIDFSHSAYAALHYITGLYRNQEVRFLLLNAYSAADHGPGGGDISETGTPEAKAAEGLTRTEHRIRLDRDNPKHVFHTRASPGNLSAAIRLVMEKGNTDLIVMGNKGSTHDKNIFMGSNAIRILNDIHSCPVLTVPEEVNADKPQEIAFASAFNRDYRTESLRPLLEIATMCSAAIRIVHINEEEGLSKEQMQHLNHLIHFMGNTAHTLHWIPDYRTKAGAINAFITEMGIGMLAIVHQKHGFLDSLLGKPVLRKIQFMVSVPMLILTDGK